MVTIIPSYVYSIFAALIVGTIIVSSCSLSMLNLRKEAENQQLANVDEYVAAQSLNLIAHVTEDGQNTTQFLNLPSQVGNQEYWICLTSLTNDSSGVWVASGFGATVNLNQPQICIPANVVVSGSFVSDWGRAFLQCCYVNQTVTLTLNCE